MARAARDAVSSLAAMETADQSGAGNRDLRGRSLSLRARGPASSARPRFPGWRPAVGQRSQAAVGGTPLAPPISLMVAKTFGVTKTF